MKDREIHEKHRMSPRYRRGSSIEVSYLFSPYYSVDPRSIDSGSNILATPYYQE
jgi:hypothetical protein